MSSSLIVKSTTLQLSFQSVMPYELYTICRSAQVLRDVNSENWTAWNS